LEKKEIISETVGEVALIAGTTSQGATVLGPGLIRHAGAGETVIGRFKGKNDHYVENIAAEFNRCQLETKMSDNVAGLLWGKLLVNVGINPFVFKKVKEVARLTKVNRSSMLQDLDRGRRTEIDFKQRIFSGRL